MWCKYYLLMYVNGMGEGRIKENYGRGEFSYDIL
jgi:hypothetical protein